MKKTFILIILLALAGGLMFCRQADKQDRRTYKLALTDQEVQDINSLVGKNELITRSYHNLMSESDQALSKGVEVPPPGESGGYEHEKHKQNYRDMKKTGIMFRLTGDEKYARFIKDMLDAYAEMYPKLGPHPLAHNQKPGKLFHQTLNETVWLLNTAQAYDAVYDWLSQEDRKNYEENIFNVMVRWFTEEYPHEFDRIHNHGMWMAASVGMIGYVMENQDWVDMALYGTKKDGSGGFLAQISQLFSPDGYYMEGAYYVRYALRPFLFFAEAIERNQPEIKIYQFKNQLVKKAFYSALQMTYPNGAFIPINDASRSMDINAPGMVYGTSLLYDRYGPDDNLLGIADIQNQVYLNGAGVKLANDYARKKVKRPTWESIEFTDGQDGKQGGFGLLRTGEGDDQTVLSMKYGVHGLGHGHFDKLHFMFWDQRREVIPDYGFVRWINIEPKFGGRYLPENNTWAKQTIAHNTVVVDQRSQNRGNRKVADKVHGKRFFFETDNPDLQVMSARADDHYPGVKMHRTLFLVRDEDMEYPFVIDIYRLESDEEHSYDYPLHYHGQIMASSFDYLSHDAMLKPLGNAFGYQHIWNEAEARPEASGWVSWLSGHRFYTWVFSGTPDSKFYFGRTAANDPNFNLRTEPLFVLRQTGQDHVFASVIEPHGYFSEAAEVSRNAYSTIRAIKVIGHNDTGTVIHILGDRDLEWLATVYNGENPDPQAEHSVRFRGETFNWTGNYSLSKIK
ncbi:MAG: Heparinase II/III family protein [Proteiniphilum acetatigenes]|uniref:Heparinase II/III family protein n=1 Tax=Proteiniphilum acetatigenes TaxID=294710 RepID=A0A101HL45_9BACT|nr:MAG: Heparinase II/III family protein [Proteiniphilum acetatigenes]